MFSGIVEETGRVRRLEIRGNLMRLEVEAQKALEGTKIGDSIAVNGTCLTVVAQDANTFAVEIIAETQRRTNLGSLEQGGSVNLERSMAVGATIGGHFVQGHIDGTGRVAEVVRDRDDVEIHFLAPPEIMKYIVPKGYIAVDGISLTLVKRLDDRFSIAFIPFTLEHTIAGRYRPGSVVNLEVDILGKYVERFIINWKQEV